MVQALTSAQIEFPTTANISVLRRLYEENIKGQENDEQSESPVSDQNPITEDPDVMAANSENRRDQEENLD